MCAAVRASASRVRVCVVRAGRAIASGNDARVVRPAARIGVSTMTRVAARAAHGRASTVGTSFVSRQACGVDSAVCDVLATRPGRRVLDAVDPASSGPRPAGAAPARVGPRHRWRPTRVRCVASFVASWAKGCVNGVGLATRRGPSPGLRISRRRWPTHQVGSWTSPTSPSSATASSELT